MGDDDNSRDSWDVLEEYGGIVCLPGDGWLDTK